MKLLLVTEKKLEDLEKKESKKKEKNPNKK